MSDLLDRLRRALAGRYEIERELGQGGMAIVFLARDLHLGRQVAIKVFRPEVAHALGPDRFLREIRTAAKLNHPNILALHEAGEGDGLLFYVMPYVEGESLADRMGREGQLPIEDALDICRQVATALHHAHTRGVVHRDIKPGNILLTGRTALVADFGIAQAAEEPGDARITATGLTIGTPAYMSPEQALGSRRLDGRSDLYSLGCVLYEMLVGEPPFTGPSLQIVAARHTNERIPGIRTVRDTVPRPVEQAVVRALAKSPADRFATAEDFAAALAPERLTRDALVADSGPPGAVRRRLWLGAGLAIVIALSVAAGFLLQGTGGVDVPLPADRVAVLPFRTTGTDADLARLGDEMVERLAQRLPGEGGLTAVFPGAVRAALAGAGRDSGEVPSEQAAIHLARTAGAGTVLLGELWSTEGRLSLRAALRRVPSGEVVAQTGDLTGPADSVAQLLDRLAARLLLLVSSEPASRHERVANAPLPLVRTWLAGRNAFLRGRYAEAVQRYNDVLRADSTFAPAALGLLAAGVFQSDDSIAYRGAVLTRAILPTLDTRDRIYFDALAGPDWPAPSSFPALIRARDAATIAAPDRPEAWFMLGEALFHNGPWTGAPDVLQRAAAAFRSAIELEPEFVPAIGHLIDLGASAGETALVRELAPRYLALDSTGALADYYRWRVAVALDDRRGLAAMRTRITRLDPAALERMVNVAQLDGVGLADALAAAEALWSQSGRQDATRWAFTKLRELALNRGRPAEARAVTQRRIANLPLRARDQLSEVVDALYWDADTTLAAQIVARVAPEIEHGPRRTTDPGDDVHFSACAIGLWRVSRGESAPVPAIIASLRRVPDPLANLQTAYIHVCADLLEARLAAVEGRPDARRHLERLDSLMRNAPQAITWILAAANLTVAQLWEAQGELDRALSATRRRVYITEVGEQRVLAAHSTFLREEGRLAALIGDRNAAIRAWNRYLALRADPEPALAPEVARIRDELARLTRR